METTKWRFSFKHVKFECDPFLFKDPTNSEWQWGTDSVSHTHKFCFKGLNSVLIFQPHLLYFI